MDEYRSFQVCINFFIYHYYGETRIFRVRYRLVKFFLAFFYSLVSILIGIWRIPGISTVGNIGSVIVAIKINARGGNDYTTLSIEKEFDERTNYVWRNLSRDTKSEVTRMQVQRLCEFQDVYTTTGEELYGDQNGQVLRIKINDGIGSQLTRLRIYEVLKAIKMYEDSQDRLWE